MIKRSGRRSNSFSMRPASMTVMFACWLWLGVSIFWGYSLSHDIAGAALFSVSIGLTPVLLIALMMNLFTRKPGS